MKLTVALILLTLTSYGQQLRLTMRIERYYQYDDRLDPYARESTTTIEPVTFEWSKKSRELLITTSTDSLKLYAQSSVYILGSNYSNYEYYKINYQSYWLQIISHEKGLRISLVPLTPLTDYYVPVYIFSFDSSISETNKQEERL